VLLYFEQVSNFNACGQCGASDGEKGYRVLYFTKDWNYKKYEEFLTESCWENIYDTTETKSKDKSTIKYKVGKSDSTPAYTFTVDIKCIHCKIKIKESSLLNSLLFFILVICLLFSKSLY
jgi:hypothetical protein